MARVDGGAPASPSSPGPPALLRLALGEAVRALAGRRLWLVVALVGVYGAAAVVVERDAVARGAGIPPSRALGLAVGLQALWLGALALPLAVGGLLAYDRSSGRAAMQRARGIGATGLAAAHLSAATLVAVVATVVGAAIIVVVAWGVSEPVGDTTAAAVPFWHTLLDASPSRWVLVVSGVQALAASALLSLSLLLAVLGGGPRLCEIVPPLGLLGLGFAMAGPLGFLNPLERLSFLQLHAVPWARTGSMIGYWAVVLAVAGAAVLTAARKGGLA
jgi:hypothetical protein